MMSTLSPKTYSSQIQSEGKDLIINELKTKIFELEQNQQIMILYTQNLNHYQTKLRY